MTIPHHEKFWTVEQLADEFQLNPLTIRSWIKTGTLTTIKIGDRHRIYESHWKQFLERSNNER
jgi:excisionase family DNA binding protein